MVKGRFGSVTIRLKEYCCLALMLLCNSAVSFRMTRSNPDSQSETAGTYAMFPSCTNLTGPWGAQI